MKKSMQFVCPFLLFSLSLFLIELVVAQNSTVDFNIGVVLNLDTWIGKMGLSCMSLALSDFYATRSFYKTRLVFHTRDSKNETIAAASAALDLVKNVQVQAIIGPQTSGQADFVVNIGEQAQVPIVSFSATSPSLSSVRTPYFIRTTQNDSSQVKAISAIVEAFGWREAVPIFVDNEYGNGLIPYLIDAFQEIDTRVPYRSIIPPSATDDQILEELYKLMTMQTRVFIVHMAPSLGSRLFLKAKEVGMMSEGYAWIITDGITDLLNSMDPLVIESMQGVLGIGPFLPISRELNNFRVRWRKKFMEENPDIERPELDIYGLWAYDTVWALALAAEKVGAAGMNLTFNKIEDTENSTDLSTFGVSQIGPKFLQTILNTEFEGLSGGFHLVDGQLQSSVFQIINVIGNGWRSAGFWTPSNGLLRESIKGSSKSLLPTSKEKLGVVIWPGDSTRAPKGWVIPTSGKKLKIGVPVKDGFTEFVKISRDSTNNTVITGYCIDVFNAVMEALPYAVPYEFIPFEKADGSTAGTYNDMIYQVYIQKFDVVVGDTTIVANRSKYVDFSLPYAESGVTMIVPIKDGENKNAWIFLKPLTRDLWLTSAAFFIFTGFVIWVLEHRINEEFRGPRNHQVGLIFWFSFSTLVFAHKEKVVSNLARFVVIIWIFVVLILTSSYTANLTSMLTVQRLTPTVTDVKELIKNGQRVGYQRGSFVLGLLKQIGFDESKLMVYNSTEDCNDALSKGSNNGGIDAAFDEMPYIRVFLARHCAKYMIVGPTYKTDGFGFAFPRGSPLVPDVSRAILNVTEGEKMTEIELAWFGQQISCPDPSTMVSSNSLSLSSFWGLFLIAGVASCLALFVFSVLFFYDHWDILKHVDHRTSIWQRIVFLGWLFDQEDPSIHTYTKTKTQEKSTKTAIGGEASTKLHTPPSPSISNQTDGMFTSSEDQGMLSAEFGYLNPERVTSQETTPSFELSNRNIETPTTHGITEERN